jgi:hypothetical protein
MQLGQVVFEVVNLYCRYCPFRKGKARLFVTLCKITKFRPAPTTVKSIDGRSLQVDLSWGGMEELYFLGEYERSVTAAITAVTRPGDLCIDVGANIGWFSTLLASLACRTPNSEGHSGHILAIEPSAQTRTFLDRNLALSPDRSR